MTRAITMMLCLFSLINIAEPITNKFEVHWYQPPATNGGCNKWIIVSNPTVFHLSGVVDLSKVKVEMVITNPTPYAQSWNYTNFYSTNSFCNIIAQGF